MIGLSQEKFDRLLSKIEQINNNLAVRKSEHDSIDQRITDLSREISDMKIKLFGSGASTMEQIDRKIRSR